MVDVTSCSAGFWEGKHIGGTSFIVLNLASFLKDDCRVVLAKQEITRLLETLQKQQQQFTELADHIQLDASIPVTFTKVQFSHV